MYNIKSAKVKCQYCGKEMIVYPSEVDKRKYCSRNCANKGRFQCEKGEFDTSLAWERSSSDKSRWSCPYAVNVSCGMRVCSKCGWNPEVAKARLEAMGYGD